MDDKRLIKALTHLGTMTSAATLRRSVPGITDLELWSALYEHQAQILGQLATLEPAARAERLKEYGASHGAN